MLLSDRYPFLTNYFTQALNDNTRPLPQSLLFYGNDLEAQYTLSKEIARLLNCQKDKEDDCDCLNCKWIREDSHPAVMTISRVDNKPEDDESKTVISIKQSAFIKETLVNASEFHRVFIFCNRDEEGHIAGLNQVNFQAETANSLLKIIEEPQPGVTFIFLCRYIDDLLSTIISRSQCFFVPSGAKADYEYSSIDGIFTNYWEFERKDIFDISQKLQDLSKEIPTIRILENIQNYILTVLKSNPRETKFIEHIKIIEDCKKQAKLGVKPVNIFDDLCLKLIK
ncbi:MAG: hypothetical protein NC408_05030 [Candidatus Gastranaerophilales bacterium]|nr:hypothetical protein [Candidatus Gastranaerophilales bacterium]MCM1072300.1 hypothetical protein [Bacteroides sp.]